MSTPVNPTMPDWLKRTLRTFVQAFLGSVIAAWTAGNYSETVPDWNALKTVLIAATIAAIIAAVSALQNILEDSTGKAALPK